MRIAYCLDCEKEVFVYEDTPYGDFHVVEIRDDDVDYCNGPFTTSAPMELSDQDWESIFNNIPDDQELAQMDANAVEMFS